MKALSDNKLVLVKTDHQRIGSVITSASLPRNLCTTNNSQFRDTWGNGSLTFQTLRADGTCSLQGGESAHLFYFFGFS